MMAMLLTCEGSSLGKRSTFTATGVEVSAAAAEPTPPPPPRCGDRKRRGDRSRATGCQSSGFA